MCPGKASGRNKLKGIRNSLRAHLLAFPPLDRATPSRLGFFIICRSSQRPILSLAPVLKSPFQVAVSSKMVMPRAHSALPVCVLLLRKETAYFDRISYSTHIPHCPFCYCKGVGVGCASALLSHTLSLVEPTALRGSADGFISSRPPFSFPPPLQGMISSSSNTIFYFVGKEDRP
jgi:hypothetical protein